MPSDTSETLSDIRDTLEALESSLLRYEQLIHQSGEDTSLIHAMIRFAHNAKGAFASIDDSAAVSILHRTEDALDQLRNRKIAPSMELAGALIESVGAVLGYLEDEKAEKRFPICIDRIEKLLRLSATDDVIPALAVSNEIIEKVRTLNARLFVIDKLVMATLTKSTLHELPLVADLSSIGEIVDAKIPDATPGQAEITISIYFATTASDDELALTIFDTYREVPLDTHKPKLDTPTRTNISERRTLRILIVDDDLVTRIILTKILSAYGRCDAVVNGQEAQISWVVALEESDPYDLISLDVRMPEMDGRQFLRHMRQLESERKVTFTPSTKVIMTTAASENRNILGAFRDGREGYLLKPINPDEVKLLLQKLGFHLLS